MARTGIRDMSLAFLQKTVRNNEQDSVQMQDTKSTYKNRLCFYILTTKYIKKK